MMRARPRALLLAVVALLAVTALAIGASRHRSRDPAVEAGRRPTLLLLTSLPLLFNEDVSLQMGSSPALAALQRRFRVMPISVTNRAELARGRLLLLAQPIAQTPENLVTLDDWVRGGGRLLLLADPTLEWPSKLPLGNAGRPLPMFVDTGLLAHWGLRLDAPDKRGVVGRRLAGYDVLTVSPGALYGNCSIAADRLAAHCRVGRGEVTVVADADLLDVDQLGGDPNHNLGAVLAELASLAHS